jgi:hypothetical protein
MKKSSNFGYFISLLGKKLKVEIYQLDADLSAEYIITFDDTKNTPYGFLLKNSAFKRFVDNAQIAFGVCVANCEVIAKAIATYIMLYGPAESVVNYLVFERGANDTPTFTNTYTTLFNPGNIIINVSSFKCSIDDIDFSMLRQTLDARVRHDGFILNEAR